MYFSIKFVFLLIISFVILYYGVDYFARLIGKKFKIHVGSIGFLSIGDLSYSGNIPGPQQSQHSFTVSVNKFYLQVRRPNLNRKTWLTITIDGLNLNFSTIKIFTQAKSRRAHVRRQSLISVVPQKAWWSSVRVLRFIMGKLSSIPSQFFLSVITNFVNVEASSINVLIQDLGKFQINGCNLGMSLFADVDVGNSNNNNNFINNSNDNIYSDKQHYRNDSEQHSFRNRRHVFSKKILDITFSFSSLSIQDIESVNKLNSTSSLIQGLPDISPAISIPYDTEIILSCHLSPTCTSLISFDINIDLNRINIGIDSILRLVKIIQSKIPKKVKRGPLGRVNTHSPNNSKGFKMANLLDSSLARKIGMSRRKKSPIEYFGSANLKLNLINVKYQFSDLENIKYNELPLNFQLLIKGLSTSLKQNNGNSFNRQRNSILFSEDVPKPIELIMDFSVDDIRSDLVDKNNKFFRMIQVDKINSKMLISKPLIQNADYDPNSLSLSGTLEISSPTISIDYEKFDLIVNIIDSIKKLGIEEKHESSQLSPQSRRSSRSHVHKESNQQINGIPKLVATCSIINPLIKITGIPNYTRNDDYSQLSFGFQDILFDVNGDYTELNDLPSTQHKYVLSRRYNRGWTPPNFSLIYNLIVSLKTRNMRLYTLEDDLIFNQSLEFSLAFSALGLVGSFNNDSDNDPTTFITALETETIQADISWTVDELEINLFDNSTFSLLKQLIDVTKRFQKVEIKKHDDFSPTEMVQPPIVNATSPITYTEALLCHVSLNSIGIKIAGIDSFIDSSTSRGIDFRLQEIAFNYKGSRASIDPMACYDERIKLGISTEDYSEIQYDTGGLLRGFLKEIKLTPILASWDKELFKNTTPLINIPEIEIQSNFTLEYSQNDYDIVVNAIIKIQEVNLKYSLLYHYCCLVGIINIFRLLQITFENENNSKLPTSNSSNRILSKINANVAVNYINVSVDLQDDNKIFARIDLLNYKFVSPTDHGVRIKKLRVYGTSPVEEGLWDEIGRVENTKILLLDDDTKDGKFKNNVSNENNGNSNEKKFDKMIRIQSDSIHVRIPHKFILADVIESIANTAKAVKHLIERIFVNEKSSLSDPEEEEAKLLPTIQLKVGLVTFRIDDDPFESKLSLIWKVGCLEQKARLGRDIAFEAKVQAIKAHEASQSNNGNEDGGSSTILHEERTIGAFRSQPSPHANLSIDAAREALKEYNSKSWVKCVRAADPSRTNLYQKDDNPQEEVLPIQTTKPSKFPALFSATIVKFLFTLSAPSFPIEELPKYMNDIGKGLPLDTKFAVLVPMHLSAKLREAWVEVRDYPLPLAHIPSTDKFHGKNIYSFFLEGNLVVGEELSGVESIRRAVVDIVTPRQIKGDDTKYTILVPRTVSPVKLYSDLRVKIDSSRPTVCSWSISMQPAIQHFAKVFESFTKPNPDPSEAVGFWDKMRMMMHVRILAEFKGSGDLLFYAKGSRDPYLVTGRGAGFVLCWSKNVEIRLGFPNDQNEVLQVDSEEFTCAIPNLAAVVSDGSLSADNTGLESKLQNESLTDSETSTIRTLNSPNTTVDDVLHGNILKRIMKLCGGVRYGMGVHFQKLCNNDHGPCSTCGGQRKCRLTDFIPHYEIITRMPEYAIVPRGQIYDSFKGFRSDFVHLSVSVSCPINLNNSNNSDGHEKKLRNSIELSPKSLQHILSWAFLFEPAMTIPIRQGALFPSLEPPSPKLGKYLGTVKIKICVGPLFLSHFYREDAFEPLNGRTHVVGIKGKIESFKFDMHLRSKENIIEVEGEKEVKGRDIILHEAEVDLKNLDFRGIAARYVQDNVFSGFSDESDGDGREFLLGKDEDFMLTHAEDEEWIDEANFVELDMALPDFKPGVRVLPLMRSPQMMYYKRPDEHDTYEEKKTDQETHICVMGQGRDTVQVQVDFLTERLNQLNQEIRQQTKILSDIEEKIAADSKKQILQDMSQTIQNTTAILSQKRNIIQDYLKNLEETLNNPGSKYVDEESDDNDLDEEKVNSSFNSPLWADSHGHFGHKFIIHNAEALWNNSLRNLIYKFSNLVEHHQGLTYYMSTSAVKFIRDLQKKIQEQKEKEAYEKSLKKERDSIISIGLDSYDFDAHMAAEMLRKLVGEQKTSFVVPNEVLAEANNNDQGTPKISHDDIPEGYSLRKDIFVQLINPQINLQCDKDPDSSIIMCIERAQLKTFSIVEDWSKGDFINEVVKTRTFFGIDNAQIFTSRKQDFLNDYYSKILTANNYGAKGSENWPVWVPMEALISNTALPFQRIVKRTSATTRYDKFNNLRIKGSDIKKDDKNGKDNNNHIEQESDKLEVNGSKKEEVDKRMDSFHINVPNIKISATSDQYCIFFDIVTDLFTYREPAQRERSERLEAILLAADLDNLEGAAERVSALQEQIRQLDDMRLQYELHSIELDEEGLKELRAVEVELINLQEELYLLMKAITASQEKKQKAESMVPLKLIATADEAIWYMQENDRKPFCEWKLSSANFIRMTKEGNASMNTLEIDHVIVMNKLTSPVFKELISPHIDHRRPVDFSRNKMIRVYWEELEPVAGIAMVEHFEINMFPLKFQMQYDVGKLMMMYIFPEKKKEYMMKQNNVKANENAQGSHSLEQKRSSVGSEQTTKSLKKTTESYSDSSVSESQETVGDGYVNVFSDDNTMSISSGVGKKQSSKSTTTDDSYELELMKKRASQNRTFIYIKVPGVQHSFSYQGAKEKNLEDIYDFVFTMPTLEYQNKTWSWLDFLEHIKKDFLRSILYHTGSLINVKFRGRPTTDNVLSNEAVVPSLATALVTATAAANVTALMNDEGTNSDHDEGSDKASVLSSESHESQKKVLGIKIKKHEKRDSLTRSIPFTNFHMHKESSGTVLSQSSTSTKSIDSSVESENEKGKLLFGKLYNENR
ncbi:hypothetical protein RclHR1_02870014 [Rhizophagus clarus]|uniref:FMP27 GFWDK domain-containing protein n=1 Tax=Rhizophagus clarus TaxID=94130 RepID=A0A2Z6RXW7_9GLOM|nr:hypothetical protein RclHR1_02870014 [Rhizophagus clarus]